MTREPVFYDTDSAKLGYTSSVTGAWISLDGSTPPPASGPISPPRALSATVDASRRCALAWRPPASGTAVAYQVHELRKHPDATLKATVTRDSRLSGGLSPFVFEYAVRAVAEDGSLSAFSNTVIVTVTAKGGSTAPGQPAGWDTAAPPTDPAPPVPEEPPVVPPTAPSTDVRYPMDLMPDYWKLTLPLWSPSSSSKVWEVLKDGTPDLDTFSHSEWFRLNAAKTGIEMGAFYEGAHTPNSMNVRCELREMNASGTDVATWSTTSGRHVLDVETQVDRLDGNHCVIAQIHGGDDDVTVWRLEGSTLWITAGDTAHGFQAMTDYQLGTRIRVGFDASGGKVRYFLNGQKVPFELSAADSSSYFKAGNYMQRKGAAGSKTFVTLYKAVVTHS